MIFLPIATIFTVVFMAPAFLLMPFILPILPYAVAILAGFFYTPFRSAQLGLKRGVENFASIVFELVTFDAMLTNDNDKQVLDYCDDNYSSHIDSIFLSYRKFRQRGIIPLTIEEKRALVTAVNTETKNPLSFFSALPRDITNIIKTYTLEDRLVLQR